jgi:hypothetical protein
MATPRIRKAPTMAEINAQTAALNKKLGATGTPSSLPNTKSQLRPKPAATPAPTLKQRAQAMFQGVRKDVQNTRRDNIDAAVEGKKPYMKRK